MVIDPYFKGEDEEVNMLGIPLDQTEDSNLSGLKPLYGLEWLAFDASVNNDVAEILSQNGFLAN